MRVLVEYNPADGVITFPDGVSVSSNLISLTYPDHHEQGGGGIKPSPRALAELKAGGFTADEIIDMKKAGLI